MAMSDALNIAVVGAGRMGCTHLRALAGAESLRVVAVVDPSTAARSRAESLSPGVRTHADLAGAVARRWHRGGADRGAVQPASATWSQPVRTLRLPILCEKPCGTTTAEIAAAGAACRDAGVLLQIGYWRRFVPELIGLRQRILSGALGEIALVSCWQWDAEPASPEFRRASGGITVDMGVHEFDQIRWLTGQEIGGLTPVTSPVSSVEPVPGDVESFAMLGELSAGAVGVRLARPPLRPRRPRLGRGDRHAAATSASRCSGATAETPSSSPPCARRPRTSRAASAAARSASARRTTMRSARSRSPSAPSGSSA